MVDNKFNNFLLDWPKTIKWRYSLQLNGDAYTMTCQYVPTNDGKEKHTNISYILGTHGIARSNWVNHSWSQYPSDLYTSDNFVGFDVNVPLSPHEYNSALNNTPSDTRDVQILVEIRYRI